MNKFIYIQNLKLGYLSGFGFGRIRWDNNIAFAKKFATIKEAEAIVKIHKLSGVYITNMKYIK